MTTNPQGRFMNTRIHQIIVVLLLFYVPLSSAQSWEGEGSASSPYIIQSGEDLQLLAQRVNDGDDCENIYFKLVADIDLSSICGDALGDWNSIGSIDNYFEGAFDGDEHTISHLYIQSSSNTFYKGLFGYIGPHGSVSNLKVEGSVYASFWAGILAGASGGEISNCEIVGGKAESFHCTGGVVGGNFGKISKCRNRAVVQGALATGGICGYNYGGLYDCVNSGEVYGYNGAGGVTGYNGGIPTFSNCYDIPMGIIENPANLAFVSGKIKVGGIAGRNDGLIFNAFNVGDLTANEQVGGLAGCNGGFDGVDGFILNSYNAGMVSASITQAGGVVGVNNAVGDIFNVYNSGRVIVPGEGGALVATNDGNVNHCSVIGEDVELVSIDNGFMTDCRIFSEDSMPQLSEYLNQWVSNSYDLSFFRWECQNEKSLPTFVEGLPSPNRVESYEFANVNFLKISGGKGELSLLAFKDMNVCIYTVSGKVVRYLHLVAWEQKTIKIPLGIYFVNGKEVLVR